MLFRVHFISIDPDLFFEGQEYRPYEYSDEKVAKYIQRQKDLDRVILAIMCDGEIVTQEVEEVMLIVIAREGTAIG